MTSYAKLSVSDNVQVTDNEEFYTHGTKKTSNVFFSESDYAPIPITVTGALDNIARIGVRLNSNLLDRLSSKGIDTVTIASAAENLIKEGNFVSDDSLYVIGVTENGAEAVLSRHQHTWEYKASGATITAECSQCGKNGGSVTINAPAGSSLTYDGKGKEAALDGRFTTGEANLTISYTSKDGNINYNVPIDAGDYKASITAGGVTVSADYTVEKAKLTVTANENTITYGDAPADKGVTYKGFENGENESVLNGSLNYTFSYSPYGAAGLYIITPDGLTADNYEIDFVPGTMTVVPREVTLSWNNTENRIYGDGKLVNATAGNLLNGDEIGVDVTDGDKTEVGMHTATATGLTGSKAGNYKLNSSEIIATGTIKPKSIPVLDGDVTLSIAELTYGEKLGKIEISGIMKDPVTNEKVEGIFTWQNPNEVPNAGICNASWTFTPAAGYEKYAAANGAVTVKVNKADILEGVDYKAPAAAAKLEYNGKEQELIAAGAATIGIMQYKLGENGTWGTDIPTATNAGSYGVYYRVVGSNNYNDTEAQKITCEIEKRSVTVSNKQEGGYQTTYMYGNIISKPR